jgi:catechol 2,3-dioxygenase-like lactoylglutathione lyase family enzyme
MSSYVKATEQLILEIYTGDLKASRAFYQSFGFEVVREESNFLALRWEQSMLFLEEVKDCATPDGQVGNIRIMVSDVDHYWELCLKLKAHVLRPIENRYYGLRDFSIAGPDGIGLRFATRLPDSH